MNSLANLVIHCSYPISIIVFLKIVKKPYWISRLGTVRWAFLVAQSVKNLPAMQETRVQSLSWEDPLEKEMATHSSILAWRIPWTEEFGGLYGPWGHKELDMTEWLRHSTVWNEWDRLLLITESSGKVGWGWGVARNLWSGSSHINSSSLLIVPYLLKSPC